MVSALVATIVAGITGFCFTLGKFGAAFAAACAIFGAQWFTQASLAANAKTCVFIAVVPAPLAVQYHGSGCR